MWGLRAPSVTCGSFFSDRLQVNECQFGPQRSVHGQVTWQPFYLKMLPVYLWAAQLFIHHFLRLLKRVLCRAKEKPREKHLNKERALTISLVSSTTNIVIEVVFSNVAEVEMKSQAPSWKDKKWERCCVSEGNRIPRLRARYCLAENISPHSWLWIPHPLDASPRNQAASFFIAVTLQCAVFHGSPSV